MLSGCGMNQFQRKRLNVATVAVAVLVLFQLFFRYAYERQSAGLTWRVDRLTGAVCRMPCEPAPAAATSSLAADPNSTATPSEADLDTDAIELTKPFLNPYLGGAHYEWVAHAANPLLDGDKVRLVCYCDPKGWGYRYEAHLDTRRVFEINGNVVLEQKYGIRAYASATEPP